ncbi:MAG: MBL fold metallo-hydrolase [Gemmatimonadota bacterium]
MRDVLRWRLQRTRNGVEPSPPADAFMTAAHDIAAPAANAGEVRITWVGQCTFLVQLGGFNVLTDPVWSRRASPLQFAGPERLVPPGVAFEDLPPIDVVLLSHDHYDHLDAHTVRRIGRRFGARVHWVTPLGYREWLGDHAVQTHDAPTTSELDWWQSIDVPMHSTAAPSARLRITAAPSQHWTRRTPFDARRRLWASFALESAGHRLFFCGDSGYHPGFAAIAAVLGPFDAVLMPIGAYAPRWFMRAAHMNPEEAVRAYEDLGATGIFTAMHWGTFRLADEPVFEPPARVRAAWAARGLDSGALWIPQHGETRIIHDSRFTIHASP